MNPPILVAPAAEVTRRPTGDPPGDPPGDFAPVLAQAAQAPDPKSRKDGARTATAEGADTEAAQTEVLEGGGEAETGTGTPVTARTAEAQPAGAQALAVATLVTDTGFIEPVSAEAVSVAPVPTAQPATDDAPVTAAPQPLAPVTALQPGAAPEQDGTYQAVAIKAPSGDGWSPTGVPAEAAAAAVAEAVPTTAPVVVDPAVAPKTEPAQPTKTQFDPSRPLEPTATQAAAQVVTPVENAPTEQATPETTADTLPTPSGSEHHDQPAPGRQRPRDLAEAASNAQPQAAKSAVESQPTETAAAPTPVAGAEAHKHAQPKPAVTAAVAPATQPEAATTNGEAPVQGQPVSTAQQTLAVERPTFDVPVRAHAQLAELAHTARTVVRMAVREGATQAHITLHPAELGQVEIRLRYHAGGVSADVLTDSPIAAQVLQQASAELKRSLEAQGLVVHDLDVRQGSQEERRALHEHRHHGHHGHDRAHATDHLDKTTVDVSSLPLAAGAVDVLA